MLEIWKDVKNYEGEYQVSNTGKVRSLNYNYLGQVRELKQTLSNKGYCKVVLHRPKGTQRHFSVHRLVAEAFIPNPDNLPQVNHKDECKTNNCVDNLEWCDCKYNSNYGTRNERIVQKMRKSILQFTLDGVFVKEWESIKSAAETFGVKDCSISNALTGRKKTAGGFIWKYK